MAGERHAFAITPDDDNNLSVVVKKIYVGTGGHVAVILAKDSSSVQLKNVPSGTTIEVAIKKVLVTGTTALDLVGIY